MGQDPGPRKAHGLLVSPLALAEARRTAELKADDSGRALMELQLVIAGDESLGRALQRVADLAVRHLDGIDEASVSLYLRGAAVSAAFTGPTAAALDERQYEAGFGPCVLAAKTGRAVLVPSVAPGAMSTLEDFATAARRTSVRSAAALPLRSKQGLRGALNTYTFGEVPLSRADLAHAQEFATLAGAALSAAVTFSAALKDVENVREAMQSRAIIEQAKGVLMYRLGVDADEAFAEICKMSQDSNRKVRHISAEIIDGLSRGR